MLSLFPAICLGLRDRRGTLRLTLRAGNVLYSRRRRSALARLLLAWLLLVQLLLA